MEKDLDKLQAFKLDKSQLPESIAQNAAGLAYRLSKVVTNMDIYTVAPWNSLVWGVDADEDFIQVGNCFLPKMLHDEDILKPIDDSMKTSEDGERTPFKVVGSRTFDKKQPACAASMPNLGLPYCTTPDITDLDGYNRAPYLSIIWGVKQGDFVKVGSRFLPMVSQFGETTLIPVGEKAKDNADVKLTLAFLKDKTEEHSRQLNQMSTSRDAPGDEVNRFQELEKRLQNLEEKLGSSAPNSETENNLAPGAEFKPNEKQREVRSWRRLEAIIKDVAENRERIEMVAKEVNTLLDNCATKVYVQAMELRLSADMQKFQTFDTNMNELASRRAFQDEGGSYKGYPELEAQMASLETRLLQVSTTNKFGLESYQELEPRLASLEKKMSELAQAPTSSPEFKFINTLKAHVQNEILTFRQDLESRVQVCEAYLSEKSIAKAFEANVTVELNQIKENVAMQLTSQGEDLAERFSRLEKAIEASSPAPSSSASMPQVTSPYSQRAVREFEERLQSTPASPATIVLPTEQAKQSTSPIMPVPAASPLPMYRATSGALQVYQVPMSPQSLTAPNTAPGALSGALSIPQTYLSAAVTATPIQRHVASRSVSPAPINYRTTSPAPIYSSATGAMTPRSQTPTSKPVSPRTLIIGSAGQYPSTTFPFAS